MITGIPILFSDEEFAALGKTVWAFTVLEHELARGALKLSWEESEANASGTIDNKIAKAIKGSMKGRYKEFTNAFTALHDDEEPNEWLESANAAFDKCLYWRDTICHGNWGKSEDGRLSIRFVDRQSFDAKQDVDPVFLSIEDLGKIRDMALSLTIEIADKAGTVPQ